MHLFYVDCWSDEIKLPKFFDLRFCSSQSHNESKFYLFVPLGGQKILREFENCGNLVDVIECRNQDHQTVRANLIIEVVKKSLTLSSDLSSRNSTDTIYVVGANGYGYQEIVERLQHDHPYNFQFLDSAAHTLMSVLPDWACSHCRIFFGGKDELRDHRGSGYDFVCPHCKFKFQCAAHQNHPKTMEEHNGVWSDKICIDVGCVIRGCKASSPCIKRHPLCICGCGAYFYDDKELTAHLDEIAQRRSQDYVDFSLSRQFEVYIDSQSEAIVFREKGALMMRTINDICYGQEWTVSTESGSFKKFPGILGSDLDIWISTNIVITQKQRKMICNLIRSEFESDGIEVRQMKYESHGTTFECDGIDIGLVFENSTWGQPFPPDATKLHNRKAQQLVVRALKLLSVKNESAFPRCSRLELEDLVLKVDTNETASSGFELFCQCLQYLRATRCKALKMSKRNRWMSSIAVIQSRIQSAQSVETIFDGGMCVGRLM